MTKHHALTGIRREMINVEVILFRKENESGGPLFPRIYFLTFTSMFIPLSFILILSSIWPFLPSTFSSVRQDLTSTLRVVNYHSVNYHVMTTSLHWVVCQPVCVTWAIKQKFLHFLAEILADKAQWMVACANCRHITGKYPHKTCISNRNRSGHGQVVSILT